MLTCVQVKNVDLEHVRLKIGQAIWNALLTEWERALWNFRAHVRSKISARGRLRQRLAKVTERMDELEEP